MSDFSDVFEKDIEEVDPGAEWCPWCGNTRMWKGRHAAAQHPEEWETFKNYFTRNEDTSVTWQSP